MFEALRPRACRVGASSCARRNAQGLTPNCTGSLSENSLSSAWERQSNVSKRDLTRKSETDWNRIDSMRDEDIDFSDIPEMGEEFFEDATLMMPEPKHSSAE